MANLQSILSNPKFGALAPEAQRRLLKEQFGVADDHMDRILAMAGPARVDTETGPPEPNMNPLSSNPVLGFLQQAASRVGSNVAHLPEVVNQSVIDPLLEGRDPLEVERRLKDLGAAATPGAPWFDRMRSATDALPFGQTARGMTDEFLNTIQTDSREKAYANLTGDAATQAAMMRPDVVAGGITTAAETAGPPALAALKKYGPGVAQRLGYGAGSAAITAAVRGSSPEAIAFVSGVALGDITMGSHGILGTLARKVGEALKSGMTKEEVAAKVVAPVLDTLGPRGSATPTGTAVPVEAVGPSFSMAVKETPPAPPAPIAEVKAANIGELADQAVAPPKIKATPAVVEDAMQNLIAGGVTDKNAILRSLEVFDGLEPGVAEVLAARVTKATKAANEAAADKLAPSLAKKPAEGAAAKPAAKPAEEPVVDVLKRTLESIKANPPKIPKVDKPPALSGLERQQAAIKSLVESTGNPEATSRILSRFRKGVEKADLQAMKDAASDLAEIVKDRSTAVDLLVSKGVPRQSAVSLLRDFYKRGL